MRPRRLLLWSFLFLGILGPGSAWSAGDTVFGTDQVHTVNIAFSQTAYWDSLTTYYDDGNEQYLRATVTLDGVVYENVGVRLKGNASYNHPNDKKSFRLGFDEYVDGQTWDGLKGVHLNNCWEDPTFLREKLHLDFCQAAGVPAPRANFAQVSINDTLFAFYSLVEHVNKTFLTSRFGNNGGNLYKAVDGFMSPLLSDFRWFGSDTSYYVKRYELKTEDATDRWGALIAVIDSLNNSSDPATALPAVVEMDGLYRAIATDILFDNLDSYTGSGRNFYVYFDEETGKMRWIVWDASMSLGSYANTSTANDTLGLLYVSGTTTRPLTARIFADATLQPEYLQAFCLLYHAYYSATALCARVDTLADLVRAYVYADLRKMYTDEQFETNLTSDLTIEGVVKPGLKSFLAARATSVESQLTTLGVSCATGVQPGDVVINEFQADNTAIIDPTTGLASDWVELVNTTDADIALDGMILTDDLANSTKWQFPTGSTISANGYLIVWADNSAASGLHASWALSKKGEAVGLFDADGAVLDSVTFTSQTTNATMARHPNGTGSFASGSPTFRANNDGSSVGAGSVVINEFAASNTTILDPTTSLASDWIELYNTTSENLALDGMHLTDDFTSPAKWAFPTGTTIEAYGYLIVWADDAAASGLHASWDLDADGERVGLFAADSTVVDTVSFGVQTTDVTRARVPNATGGFFGGTPTHAANNNSAHTLATGAVAINEFMADNDAIVDPAGDADDWIELVNTTTSAVDLSGLYLSDAASSPAKWQFPDGTSLAAGAFLVVWADDELAEDGLHAGFKLSASGESIVLSNPDLSVVDSTDFGAEVTNWAEARLPDGTGEFQQTAVPTPGAANVICLAVDAAPVLRTSLAGIAPNPVRAGAATVVWTLAQAGHVRLQVFDLQGRLVTTLANGETAAGTHRSSLDAHGLRPGLYLCRLQCGGVASSKKVLVLD